MDFSWISRRRLIWFFLHQDIWLNKHRNEILYIQSHHLFMFLFSFYREHSAESLRTKRRKKYKFCRDTRKWDVQWCIQNFKTGAQWGHGPWKMGPTLQNVVSIRFVSYHFVQSTIFYVVILGCGDRPERSLHRGFQSFLKAKQILIVKLRRLPKDCFCEYWLV